MSEEAAREWAGETVSKGPINMSPSVGKLAEALSKAQGQIKGAVKDSSNPFFKSKYADLASVIEAFRDPFSANGLALVQIPGNNGSQVTVETLLIHSSGEWVSGSIGVKPAKDDAQGLGSVITYLRRYAAAAFTGVAQIDDDGEAAVGRESTDRPKVTIDKKTREEFCRQVREAMANGDEMLVKQLWSEWGQEEKAYLWSLFNSQERAAMKEMRMSP